MKVYRKDSGERYTPFDHFGMTTQVVFNPDGGCEKANITLSTLPQGGGSVDEVHESSDQIFYMLKGQMKISANGELLHTVHAGDAVLITAGDIHAVINDGEEDCTFLAITVPPLEKTH